MKRIYFFTLWFLSSIFFANAQNIVDGIIVDDVYISTSFNSACVVETPSMCPPYSHLPEDCFIACKNSVVTYTAENVNATSYTWEVTGAVDYSESSDGKIITVEWGSLSSGFVKVTIGTSNGRTASDERCVSLIDNPDIKTLTLPGFSVDMSSGEKTIRVCLGETVTFFDISRNQNEIIKGHVWKSEDNFGYGFNEIKSSKNYSVDFPVEGEYKVTHTVENICGCISEEIFNVIVESSSELELSCYGTVCGTRTATYTVENITCPNYYWNVENGEIIAGQGTSNVTIQWNSSYSGYGILSLDASNCNTTCPTMMSKKIPVISDSVTILGPDTVCIDDIVRYELPMWGSTSYTWEVEDAGSDPGRWPVFQDDLYPNQKIATFPAQGTYTIKCTYSCPFLNCGPFSTTKTITVKNRLRINAASPVMCNGMPGTFTTNSNSSVDWYVYTSDNTLLYDTTGVNLIYTFSSVGEYTIKGYNYNYCDTAIYVVTVRDNPTRVDTVFGDKMACSGEGVRLETLPTDNIYYIEWMKLEDSSYRSNNEITVNPFFNSDNNNVYSIDVYQVDAEYGCRSEAYKHTIIPFTLASLQDTVYNVCPEDIVELSVTNQSPRVTYKWYLEETDAYMASVQDNHLINTVNLAVNSLVSGGDNHYNFPVLLERKYCGTESIERVVIDVNAPIIFGIQHEPIVCEEVAINFNVVDGPDNATYIWEFEGDATKEGKTVMHAFDDGGGEKIIILKGSAGRKCSYTQITDTIFVLEKPEIEILYNNNTRRLECSVSNYNASQCDYKWYKDGETVGEGNEIYVEDFNYLKSYCCEVFATTTEGEVCSATACYEYLCVNTDPHPDISREELRCGRGKYKVNNRFTDGYLNWTVVPYANISADIAPVEITFPDTGIYTITAVEQNEEGECFTHIMEDTINYAFKFELRYLCDTGIVLINNSNYRSPYTMGNIRIFLNEEEVGYEITDNGVYILQQTESPSSLRTYSCVCEVEILKNGNLEETCPVTVKSISVYPEGNITSFNVPAYTCSKTPFTVSATGNNIVSYKWYFGDGSCYSNDTIEHTYSNENTGNNLMRKDITLEAEDLNECIITRNATVIVNSNPIEGTVSQLTIPNPCPGEYCNLMFENSIPLSNSLSYLWLDVAENNTDESCNVPKTGNYIVEVSDVGLGCRYNASGNATFKTAPLAKIIANPIYCPDDEIRLWGRTGDNNTYEWYLEGNAHLLDTTHSPEGVLFVNNCTHASPYTATLVVTNEEGCSDTATHNFQVSHTPPSPQIEVVGDNCMSNPPVVLASSQNIPLHWSNGNYGTTAEYYTSGTALAYYYDTNGCKSYESDILVNYTPNYEALLTGCYYCIPDHLLPTTLDIYGLYPTTTVPNHWDWILNDETIDFGNLPIATLPILEEGEYYMQTFLPDDIECVFQSPILDIHKCDSPDNPSVWDNEGWESDNSELLDLTFTENSKIYCFVENCRLYIRLVLDIQNNNDYDVTIDDLRCLHGANIVQIDTIPLEISHNESKMVEITLHITNINTTRFSIRFYDSKNNGYYYASFSWNMFDCVNSNCLDSINALNFELDENLSTANQSLYFNFEIEYPYAQSIFTSWSEPAQIINSTINGNTVSGLLLLNYGYISNLWYNDNSAEICIHAIVCKDSTSMCHVTYCRPISEILEIAMSLESKSYSRKTGTVDDTIAIGKEAEPYLVPNPARNHVAIEGINKDDITNIDLMDMQGKMINTEIKNNIINISALQDGAYIVGVQTSNKKVYYLKLIKK